MKYDCYIPGFFNHEQKIDIADSLNKVTQVLAKTTEQYKQALERIKYLEEQLWSDENDYEKELRQINDKFAKQLEDLHKFIEKEQSFSKSLATELDHRDNEITHLKAGMLNANFIINANSLERK